VKCATITNNTNTDQTVGSNNFQHFSNQIKHQNQIIPLVNPEKSINFADPIDLIKEDNKKYNCVCGFESVHNQSYYRHKKTCKKINFETSTITTDKVANLENVVKEKDYRLKEKDEQIEYLKSLVEKAGQIADTTTKIADRNSKIADQNSKNVEKSLSALSYVIKNYSEAPNIESVKLLDYTKIKSGKHDITTTIASYYDSDQLAKYLGDYIIGYYKTEDVAKRSFWGTDVSRCTFITRTLSENNESQWVYDMKGKRIGKSIIDPMLEHIRIESLLYIDDAPGKIARLSVADGSVVTAVQRSAYKVLDDIKSGLLKNEIIKEISPYFYLNRL
jgi:hypothetical protein